MNIVELLYAKAREIPDAPAVLTAEGTLSFAELAQAIRWTAGSFSRAGLASGDRVALHASSSPRHLVSALALAHIGASHFAFQDHDPPERRREIAQRLGVVATVAGGFANDATGAPRIEPPPWRLGEIKQLIAAEVDIARGDDAPWLLSATSGTTGAPKLLSLSHAKASARTIGRTHGFPTGPGRRNLCLTHIAFNGAKQILLAHLLSGSCLVFADGLTGPEALVEFVDTRRINFIAGVPIRAVELLRLSREGELLLPGVDAFQISSTLIPESLRIQIRDRLTPNLYVAYGMGEVGMVACAPPALLASDEPGAVGKPAPGVGVEVVDDQGVVVPNGTAGRLRVRSNGTCDGYLDDPKETARSFRDGWFTTGDRVELTPHGTLIHHGRADDVIILDGLNISPAEIENVLLKHPAVTDAVALAIPSNARGNLPVAAVVLGSAVANNELMSHCRSLLGARSPVAIKPIRELPRNTAGKVRRQDLTKTMLEHLLKRSRQDARQT